MGAMAGADRELPGANPTSVTRTSSAAGGAHLSNHTPSPSQGDHRREDGTFPHRRHNQAYGRPPSTTSRRRKSKICRIHGQRWWTTRTGTALTVGLFRHESGRWTHKGGQTKIRRSHGADGTVQRAVCGQPPSHQDDATSYAKRGRARPLSTARPRTRTSTFNARANHSGSYHGFPGPRPPGRPTPHANVRRRTRRFVRGGAESGDPGNAKKVNVDHT